MGELVNLNRERKRRQRAESEKQAAINRKKHGRRKGERAQDTATAERDVKRLDGHLIEEQE